MKDYLILSDFDGTIGSTFGSAKDANGEPIYGTTEAYTQAVDGIFGKGSFDRIGGLQNRSPLQVSAALLSPAHRDDTTDSSEEIEALTDVLNSIKLEILCKQIGRPLEDGSIWPPPLPGFPVFMKQLNALNESLRDQAHLHVGVISSGHDEFITKAFEAWSSHYTVPIEPTILVTQDTIERRARNVYPTAHERRSKPSPLPLALGLMAWRSQLGLTDERGVLAPGVTRNEAHETMTRVMYVGDDPVKDGHMANRADIVFGLMYPEEPFTADPSMKQFRLGDWRQLAGVFETNMGALCEGKPYDEIVLGRPSHHPESVYARRHAERS